MGGPSGGPGRGGGGVLSDTREDRTDGEAAAADASYLRDALFLLDNLLQTWLTAWNSLGPRLLRVEQFLQADGGAGGTELAGEMQRTLAPFFRHVRDGSPYTLEWVRELAAHTARLAAAARAAPEHRRAGSLYSVLHGQLENVLPLLTHGLPEIAERARLCAVVVSAREAVRSDGADLLPLLDTLRAAANGEDAAALARGAEELRGIVARTAAAELGQTGSGIPPPAAARTHWRVLAVEDDPVWKAAIPGLVALVRRRLAPRGFRVECEVIADRETAEARVRELASAVRHRGDGTRATPWPLALLDLGVPTDPGDERAPSRDEGLALLRAVRAPTLNVPVVVLTTPANYLADHLVAARHGVRDYLLKGVDPPQRLVDSLTRIVTARPRRRLELLPETGRIIRIDGVEVRLEPAPFRTFSVIAEQAGRTGLTSAEILEHLRAGSPEIGAAERAPAVTADPHAENVRLNWAAARRETDGKGPAANAVAWLEAERWTVWRSLHVELAGANVSPTDRAAVAYYLDSRYGLPPQSAPSPSPAAEFDARNVAKHVSEVRLAITRAFNEADQPAPGGGFIVPEEEVIVCEERGGSFSYRVVAELGTPDGGARAPEAFRVLVVEDDGELWRERIARLLSHYGYAVRTAGSVDEAVEVARAFVPELMCLDLQVPQHSRTPSGSNVSSSVIDDGGGLLALERVRGFLPGVRAVVLSDLTDRDDLRARMDALGIRVSDCVPKSGAVSDTATGLPAELAWDAALILRTHRAELEAHLRATLPLPGATHLPYLHFSRAVDGSVRVTAFDQPWPLNPAQVRLLWALARRANRPVPSAVVLEVVFGSADAASAAKLKTVVQRLRGGITDRAASWFGLTDPAVAKAFAHAMVASDARAGWVLNARVTHSPELARSQEENEEEENENVG